jgi:hypothetical protein
MSRVASIISLSKPPLFSLSRKSRRRIGSLAVRDSTWSVGRATLAYLLLGALAKVLQTATEVAAASSPPRCQSPADRTSPAAPHRAPFPIACRLP